MVISVAEAFGNIGIELPVAGVAQVKSPRKNFVALAFPYPRLSAPAQTELSKELPFHWRKVYVSVLKITADPADWPT